MLHKVITMAGGFTDKAATSRAKVIRKIEGKERELSLDLERVILSEDIIVVPRCFSSRMLFLHLRSKDQWSSAVPKWWLGLGAPATSRSPFDFPTHHIFFR